MTLAQLQAIVEQLSWRLIVWSVCAPFISAGAVYAYMRWRYRVAIHWQTYLDTGLRK